jgi:hypothetical protein
MKRWYLLVTAGLVCMCTERLGAQGYGTVVPSRPLTYDYEYDYDYYARSRQPSPSDLPAEGNLAEGNLAEGNLAEGNLVVQNDAYKAASCGACGMDNWCSCDEPWRLFPALPYGFNLTGWINGGGTANADSPASRFNGPMTFNDRDEVQLNKLYAVLERTTDTSCYCFDVGGRIDLLFGTDYIFTEAVGLETRRDGSPKWNNRRFYGLAMPQAYVDFAYGDLSVKVGHFYTPLGYETVMAPGNFFYSHAYTRQYGEPFTHTGVLASYRYSDQLKTFHGVHSGWDIFDRTTERAAYMSGAQWTNYDGDFSLGFGMTTGDELNNSSVYTNRSLYSLVATLNLTDRWDYVVQHDHGWQKDFFSPGVDAEWYGINQYLFYTLNNCWKLGSRFEWFRDDDGVRVTGLRATNPINGSSFVGDFYEITLGLNWTPNNNLRVRPELRWDWFNGTGLPYDDATKDEQFTGAVDLIWLW